MAQSGYRETYVEPRGVESPDPRLLGVVRAVFRLLWTPRGLHQVVDSRFKEYEFRRSADTPPRVTLSGLVTPPELIAAGHPKGLVDYREGFQTKDDDGRVVGPVIHAYDFVAVPMNKPFPIPHDGKGPLNVGVIARSHFSITEGLPPIGLLFEEQYRVDPMTGLVDRRVYLALGEDGRPIGPGTDRPNVDQHELVGRQMAGEVTQMPTAEQAFRLNHPGVEY